MIEFSSLTHRVESMRLSDIDAVMEIEYTSFSAPWSAKAYDYELQHNANAHYFVVRAQGWDDPPVAPTTRSFWQRWFGRATPSPQSNGRDGVVGYGGFWMMTDEAHISTIASRPDARRRGIGELLLLAMI